MRERTALAAPSGELMEWRKRWQPELTDRCLTQKDDLEACGDGLNVRQMTIICTFHERRNGITACPSIRAYRRRRVVGRVSCTAAGCGAWRYQCGTAEQIGGDGR